MRTILTANELECTLNMITFLFPKNSRRKNAFLAVCYSINKEVNLHFVNEMAEFGGLIGPGNSFLDRYFTYFKLFRLHAILIFCVWDPLGKPIKSYPWFFNHLQKVSKQSKVQKVRELQIPLQSPYSNTCGLFCLYVAHYLIRKFEQQSVSLSCLESFFCLYSNRWKNY